MKLNSKKLFYIMKMFLPLGVIKVASKIYRKKHTKIFDSYLEAELACRVNAYKDLDFARLIIEKNILFNKTIQLNNNYDLEMMRTIIPFGSIESSISLTVLDFGGGGGYHASIAKSALKNGKDIFWNIVETPAIVSMAENYAIKYCSFYRSIEKAKEAVSKVDLVFTSSSLQYCSDPLDYLQKLIAIQAPYFYITRTPFLQNDNKIITVQSSKLSSNGPGPLPPQYKDTLVEYPIVYVSQFEVERLLKEKYHIKFRIDEGPGSFSFRNEKISMVGFFCELK